jgi:hypothetical protein
LLNIYLKCLTRHLTKTKTGFNGRDRCSLARRTGRNEKSKDHNDGLSTLGDPTLDATYVLVLPVMSGSGHGGKRPNAGRPKGATAQKKKNRNNSSLVAQRTDAQQKDSERSKEFCAKSDEELLKLANITNPYDSKKMAAKKEIKRREDEEEKRKQQEGEKKEREQFEREREEEKSMAALLRLAQDADECLTTGAGAEGYNREEWIGTCKQYSNNSRIC